MCHLKPFERDDGGEEATEDEVQRLPEIEEEQREDELRSDADIDTDQPLPEGMELRVFRMTLPMPSKNTSETIKAAMEIVMRLKADGFEVQRTHTDRGKEFRGKFQSWAMKRGLVVTRTAGDDPTPNGRAEVAVQFVKGMLRKALHQAGAEADFWSLASRYVNEILRCNRRGDKVMFPPFMAKVLVRKRAWKRDGLDPTMQEVSYICPSWLDHGHWTLKEDGTVAASRYTLQPAKKHETEEVWLALEGHERGPLEVRRRIRPSRSSKGRKASLRMTLTESRRNTRARCSRWWRKR